MTRFFSCFYLFFYPWPRRVELQIRETADRTEGRATRATTARYRCLVLTGGPREVYSKFEVEVGSRLFGVARALCEVAVLERGELVSVGLGEGTQRGRMKEHHDRRGKTTFTVQLLV